VPSVSNRIQLLCAIIIVAATCWIILFNKLDAAPIRTWDEVRLANNAIEMVEGGNLLVTYHNGEPEFWNTKPPLMIWLEALSVQALGIESLAFRLPAALAALATVILLFTFLYRQLREPWTPLLACVLLLATEGYVLDHGVRNGEYEGLLTLWILAYGLSFYRFMHSRDGKWIWVTALFVTLGVFTKGVQALLPLPGLVIYAAVAGRLRDLLTRRSTYLSAFAALILIAAYYAGRESLQPGYLLAVWDNELLGRYTDIVEGHRGSFWYYFIDMKFWTPLTLLALPALFIMSAQGKRVAVFAIVVAASYLIVISFAKSKLLWYEIPAYPFLAMFVAVSFRAWVMKTGLARPWARSALVALGSTAVLYFLVSLIITVERSQGPLYREEQYRDQLHRFFKEYPDTRRVVLGISEYEAPALYYRKYYAQRSKDIELADIRTLELQPGDTLLTSLSSIKDSLLSTGPLDAFFWFDGMDGYVVKNPQLAPAQ
jgi:4-amino-4-deoxy-L-arabinose transferase-like glycosyltransferase